MSKEDLSKEYLFEEDSKQADTTRASEDNGMTGAYAGADGNPADAGKSAEDADAGLDGEQEEASGEAVPNESDIEDFDRFAGEFISEEDRLKAVQERLAKALEEEDNAPKEGKDAVIADLNDRLKRQMAEFDNYRKRTEKEKAGMFELGGKNIIEKILPTIDNFERALAAVPPDKEAEAFAQGVEMIYKQMLKDLEDAGVSVIEAVGAVFDPNLHHAVMHVEDDSVGENVVVEEFQKGYLYKGSVIRYSMVKVAN